MLKEKQKIPEVNTKNKDFYYELLGILLIIIVLIVFSELGRVGFMMKIALKFMFGDWYFLLLFLAIYTGVKLLVWHKKLSFRSLPLNGFLLCFISLMILSHQAIYSYLRIHNSTGIGGIWQLYLTYFRFFDDSLVMGGGLVGAVLHQIVIFLVGEIGTIIIGVMILIFGLIFLSNNTIFSFFNKTNSQIKNINGFKARFLSYFRNLDIPAMREKIRLPGKSSVRQKKSSRITLYNLTDIPETINKKLQENFAKEAKEMLNNIFLKLKTEASLISCDISFSFTRYTYRILYNFNLNSLKERIGSIMDCYPLILYNEKTELVTIEFINKYKDLLTLRKLLSDNLDKQGIPLGCGISNEAILFRYNVDNHLYVISDDDSGYKNFFRGFIVSNLIKSPEVPLKIISFDFKQVFPELRLHKKSETYWRIEEVPGVLDDLMHEIERRINLFKVLEVATIEEANLKIDRNSTENEPLSRIIIAVSGFEKLFSDRTAYQLENKLFYLLSVGEKYGLHGIICETESLAGKSLIKNYINSKIVFRVKKITRSVEILDNDKALYLADIGEFYYKRENTIIRAQSPYIAKTEYEAILERI
ncbi:MAG: hypothetical protein FWE36_06090 [Erysipelotrichales bacterium]|nr:hypothetical protein [Erysipelotrichales bacterium]